MKKLINIRINNSDVDLINDLSNSLGLNKTETIVFALKELKKKIIPQKKNWLADYAGILKDEEVPPIEDIIKQRNTKHNPIIEEDL